MSSTLSRYSISFKGLKLGKHSFEFVLNDDFFHEFSEGEISKGQLIAKVNLNRQNHLLEFKVTIKGTVQVVCDRCLNLFDLPITFKGELFAQIGLSDADVDNDEIIYLAEEEHEVNIAQYLYESVCLSLPLKRYHGMNGTNASDCDPEMLAKMNVVNDNDNMPDEVDPRWEQLKKLKNN